MRACDFYVRSRSPDRRQISNRNRRRPTGHSRHDDLVGPNSVYPLAARPAHEQPRDLARFLRLQWQRQLVVRVNGYDLPAEDSALSHTVDEATPRAASHGPRRPGRETQRQRECCQAGTDVDLQ